MDLKYYGFNIDFFKFNEEVFTEEKIILMKKFKPIFEKAEIQTNEKEILFKNDILINFTLPENKSIDVTLMNFIKYFVKSNFDERIRIKFIYNAINWKLNFLSLENSAEITYYPEAKDKTTLKINEGLMVDITKERILNAGFKEYAQIVIQDKKDEIEALAETLQSTINKLTIDNIQESNIEEIINMNLSKVEEIEKII